MTLSVRLDPTIEAQLEQHALKLGMIKSQFVKEAIERALGLKSPAELLKTVRGQGVPASPRAVPPHRCTTICPRRTTQTEAPTSPRSWKFRSNSLRTA
ncbi:MAG: hypothetical protein ACREX4_19530 [Gammaproteobacteria bacterium]